MRRGYSPTNRSRHRRHWRERCCGNVIERCDQWPIGSVGVAGRSATLAYPALRMGKPDRRSAQERDHWVVRPAGRGDLIGRRQNGPGPGYRGGGHAHERPLGTVWPTREYENGCKARRHRAGSEASEECLCRIPGE